MAATTGLRNRSADVSVSPHCSRSAGASVRNSATSPPALNALPPAPRTTTTRTPSSASSPAKMPGNSFRIATVIVFILGWRSIHSVATGPLRSTRRNSLIYLCMWGAPKWPPTPPSARRSPTLAPRVNRRAARSPTLAPRVNRGAPRSPTLAPRANRGAPRSPTLAPRANRGAPRSPTRSSRHLHVLAVAQQAAENFARRRLGNVAHEHDTPRPLERREVGRGAAEGVERLEREAGRPRHDQRHHA